MTSQQDPDHDAPSAGDHLDGGTFVIGEVETLKVASDPLRRRMLELVREEPRTAKELAAALQVSQTRLYYHLKLLEARGLITVAETRLVSGIVEKRYRTTAYRLTIDKSLIGPTEAGSDALDAYVSVVLDQVRSEINRSVDAGLIDLGRTREDQLKPRRLVLGRRWLRLRPEQVRDFSRRYSDLLAAFADASDEANLDGAPDADGDAQYYEWLIAFFPTLSPDTAEPLDCQQG
ncbi:MAG: winged helix-turn-helix domain-containing protein [Chloroflexota bacterium]|nr:winged helix-turn-helix domain-containing protein [Chloroflexota bacterium]